MGRKAYKGARMEGLVARRYAQTRRNDMEDFRLQARALAGLLRTGYLKWREEALDVISGRTA
jgi:hypothetical protein